MTDLMPEPVTDLDALADRTPSPTTTSGPDVLDAVDEQLLDRLVGQAREGGLIVPVRHGAEGGGPRPEPWDLRVRHKGSHAPADRAIQGPLAAVRGGHRRPTATGRMARSAPGRATTRRFQAGVVAEQIRSERPSRGHHQVTPAVT